MSFDSSDLTIISIIANDDTSTEGLVLVLWPIVFFADPIPATTTEKIVFVAVMVAVVAYAHYMSKHEVRGFDEAIELRDRKEKS